MSLSPLEKKLAEVVDRVEIRGKRGRRVAILLPENLKRLLDILIENRSTGRIDIDNKYVFAQPAEAEHPVRATDVRRRHASECGAKQPELLISTSFRKHVAVIAQMLNLRDNELDVLTDFLGHDIRVHPEFYRLPQDTIQAAKVSKLLIELEKENIHRYKGKSLDEIQFDLEEPLNDDDGGSDTELESSTVDQTSISKPATSNCTEGCSDGSSKTNKTKNAVKRRMWTKDEQGAIKRQLEKYLYIEKLPGKHEIEEARKKEPLLSNRSWVQIKSFIKNVKISMKNKTDLV